MDCVMDFVPTSSLWYAKQDEPTMERDYSFLKLESTTGSSSSSYGSTGVPLLYDVIGKKGHGEAVSRPTLFFLQAGRLIYSTNLRSADDALKDASASADRNLRSLDVTPTFCIEYINSKTFRVWNSSTLPKGTTVHLPEKEKKPAAPAGGGVVASELDAAAVKGAPAAPAVPAHVPPIKPVAEDKKANAHAQAKGEASIEEKKADAPPKDAMDHKHEHEHEHHEHEHHEHEHEHSHEHKNGEKKEEEEVEVDRHVEPLHKSEEGEAMTLQFKTKEAAAEWEAALTTEREKSYFPEIAALPTFAKEVHEAVWRFIRADFSKSLALRRVYFEPEADRIVYQLYSIFAAGVPEPVMLVNVDAFVLFFSEIVSCLATAIIFLGFRLPADLLVASESRLSVEERAQMPPVTKPGMRFVELAKYVTRKVSDVAWKNNLFILPWLFGYPEVTESHKYARIASKECRKWFSKISGARGKFAHPFRCSWAQLHLILEPQPFLGFFFVDHYVNVGDVKRARSVCAGLPYDMAVCFVAIYRSPQKEVTAAHFVHYLEWDSLQRAYDEFEVKNVDNVRLMGLLGAARDIYSSPLVSAAHWTHLRQTSELEVMDACIEQLLDGMADERSPELHALREICARWMEFTKKKCMWHGGVPKAPHKALMINVLLGAMWAQNKGNIEGQKHQSKAIIAQVDPNEDRSLVAAMIAAYLVKHLGKHVHILFSSKTALREKFMRVSPYLEMMGIQTAECNFHQAADVTFCLERDLYQWYRDSIFFGHLPFSNTMLIVDDITELSIERNPNSIYGKKDEELSAPLKEFFDLFLEHGEDVAPPPAARTPVGAVTWAKTKQAYAQFKTMKEGKENGYVKHFDPVLQKDRYELLDSNGRVNPHKYHFGLEMVRYKLAGEMPSINSKFFYQSLPHIYGQYEGIYGLEPKVWMPTANASGVAGSPGGAAAVVDKTTESRKFLEVMYGAWSYNLPNDEFQRDLFKTRDPVENLSIIEPTVLESFTGVFTEAARIVSPGGTPKAKGAASESSDAKATDGASLDARWATPPPTPDAKYDTSDGAQGFSTSFSSIANLPDIVKGQMMNELCDKFYLKYPHDDGIYPSRPEHRKLIQFLEDEAQHGPTQIAEFAASVGLARTAAAFVSLYSR